MRDLQQAIVLIKSGKKPEARQILLDMLQANPDNEQAWLCMVSCATTQRQLQTSISNVLRINPANATALKLARRFDISRNTEETVDLSPDDSPTMPSNPTEAMLLGDTVVSASIELVEPPRRLGRLGLGIAILIVLLIVLIIAAVVDSEHEKRNTADAQTAQYVGHLSTPIAATNSALQVAAAQRATSYAVDEMGFYGIVAIYTATLIEETPLRLEKRLAFGIDEAISVVVAVKDEAPDLAISLAGSDLEPEVRVADAMQIYTFSQDADWTPGTYIAQVRIEEYTTLETEFDIHN